MLSIFYSVLIPRKLASIAIDGNSPLTPMVGLPGSSSSTRLGSREFDISLGRTMGRLGGKIQPGREPEPAPQLPPA